MNNTYSMEQKVSAAFTDRRCEMDISHASQLFQDAFTEFFAQYGCDAIRMSRSHGAVWAIARSKIRYERLPLWGETVRVRVLPVKLSAVSIHLNVVVESLDGATLVRCRQELCAVDVTDHSLRRVNTTPFPLDLPVEPPILDEPFRRKKVDLDEACLSYRHLVRSTDTDINGHMNNVAYVRLLLDAFPSAFWDRYFIRSFDIHYAAESREGEELSVYQQREGDTVDLQIKAGDRSLIKAFFQLEERQP